MKSSVNIALLNVAGLSAYGSLCGWALALAHARSGDPAQISGYLGTSDTADRALSAFASAYADQTERDYAELVRAVKDGRVAARQGV